jgi:hypothetical protein
VGIGQCRSGSCNEGANACDTADKPDGTTCDADGNGCTENDSCAGGICLIGNNVDCSDSSDTCNVGGCENLGGIYFACVQAPKPLNLPCDDGDYCTVDTVCDGAGSCSDGNPRDCDAELGTQCTTGFCDALAQACAPLKIPDGTSCEDNNVCTLVDNCKNGTCVGTGDACVENRLDQTLPATVAPSLVHLGFGRYATVWVDEGGQGSRVRLTDRYGSRESEEVVVSPTDTLPPTSGLSVAAQSTGEFLTLGWSGEFVCDKGFYPCEVSGALHGLQYDVDGSFLTQQALLPIDGSKFNGNTGGVLTGYESHALALPDGSYGLVSATMGKMIVSPAPGEIRWIPVSKELVPGDSVLLVSSDVTIPSTTNPPGGMTPANFDVAHAPDSSLFTVAWIVPGGGEIRARSFESTGLAVGEAWTAHTSPALNEVRELALITRPDHSLALFWEQGEVNDEASALFTRTLSADGLVQSEPQEIADTPVGHKQLGDIDTFSDGGFVVVYDDDQSDESGRAVRAQLFEPSGAPIGGSFQINSLTNGDQLDARLAVLESDTWVVAFRDEDHVLWTKRYFKDGSEHVGRLEQPITVDPNNDQVHTVGARCSTNGLFIAWEHTVPGNTGTDIRGRFFNAAGSPLNDEITLNQHTAGDQSHPAMTSNNDRATIVWSSAEADESGHGVFAVQVNASGIIASDDIQVHTTLSNQNTAPDVAMQEDGRYAITWVHEGTDADILARVYPANDGAPTLEFFANETMIGDQRAPAVAATDSSFVVFWQSKTDDRWTIVGRLIDAQGQPLTGEISMDENAPVNPATVTNHTSPAVAVGPDGNGLLCWESDGINPGEPLDHVECQRFDGQALTLQGPVFPANPAALNDTSQPAVLALPNGMLGVAWSALNIDGDGWSVQYQLFNDSGQPIGARVVANRTRAGNQIHPFITGLSHTSPTFAVGWQTEDVNAGWWDNTFRVLQPQ